MSIYSQVQQDVVAAQKSGEAVRLEALRFLRSALMSRAKDLRLLEDLSDEESLAVISKEIKKRRDAIVAFTQGGRPELAAKEQSEAELLQQYLPPQLTDSEINAIIAQAITAAGLTPPYDFGRLMGVVMKQVANRADGAKVRELVQACIQKPS
ncbi:MAG: GatB/YqeY domain-containing protein [Candidatus Komeilibacteria bacterium]